MKNGLMKFAGLFVEKVPIDEQGSDPAQSMPSPTHAQGANAPAPAALQGRFPSPSGRVAMPPSATPAQPHAPMHPAQQMIAIAVRAWVPQEYAVHLGAHGLHIVAAGGELTVDQARQWGAQVLLLSAECLGSHTYLLTSPVLPTVFVTPQHLMIPDAAGVVQVLEPLRASEVAGAAREALESWARGHA